MTSAHGKAEAMKLVVVIVESVQAGNLERVTEHVTEFDGLLGRLIAAAKREQAVADLKVVVSSGAGRA